MPSSEEIGIRPATGADAPIVATIWHSGWLDGRVGHVSEELVGARTEASFRSLRVAARRGHDGRDGRDGRRHRRRVRHGRESAWLALVAGNARARRFYERSGWIDQGPIDYPAVSERGPISVPSRPCAKRVRAGAGDAGSS
ncbi:MAG TPA: hypothetical protein VME22_05130 [Solirubrobacteraceae bacterium]|nr:hypothetical protein [Solirubrobacteraceae bacterium]